MTPTTVERPGRPTVHITVQNGSSEPGSPVEPGSAEKCGDDRDVARGLAELLADVLVLESVDERAEVGLHLVDATEIQRLNAEYMGVDRPTDVLSFPVDGPGGDPGDGHDADSPPTLVGDVVVSPEVARRNAVAHAGSPMDEYRLLVVHAALHLCGWDHASDSDRIAMWAREREIMGALDVLPSGDPWTRP